MSLTVNTRQAGDPVLSVCHYAIGMAHTGHLRNSGELMDAARPAKTKQPGRGRGQLTTKRPEGCCGAGGGRGNEKRGQRQRRGRGRKGRERRRETRSGERRKKKGKSLIHRCCRNPGHELLGVSYVYFFFPLERWIWGRVQRSDRCGFYKEGLPLPSSSLTGSKDLVWSEHAPDIC